MEIYREGVTANHNKQREYPEGNVTEKAAIEENKEEKSIEKLNQNELKQESKIEQQVAESLETTMASEVSDISGEEEVEENTQQMVKE